MHYNLFRLNPFYNAYISIYIDSAVRTQIARVQPIIDVLVGSVCVEQPVPSVLGTCTPIAEFVVFAMPAALMNCISCKMWNTG